MKLAFLTALLTLLLVGAPAALHLDRAAAQVILSDGFSRTVGNFDPMNGAVDSDWGANDNALGGAVMQTYVTTPDRTGGGVQQTVDGSQGNLRFGAAAIDYDLYLNSDVTAAGGYVLEFDFTRATAGGFLSVFFGATPSSVAAKDGSAAFGPIDQLLDYAFEVEAAFLLQNDGPTSSGKVEQWSYGARVADPLIGAYDDETTGTIGTHSAKITVAAPSGFGSGSPGSFELAIDNALVATLNANFDGGPGTFGFSSNQGGAKVDNLKVYPLGAVQEADADFDGDGDVDGRDFLVWQRGLGSSSPTLANGNANGDDAVDGLDLAIWKAQFGSGGSAAAAATSIPEPASLGLALLAALSLGALRRY